MIIEPASLGLEGILDGQQQAIIERNSAVADSAGGKATSAWAALETVACFIWWGTGATITRIGGVQVKPEQTVDLQTGGMLLPAGTDVTARDRIAQVLDADGNVLEDGPFEILAVAAFLPVTELNLRRAR